MSAQCFGASCLDNDVLCLLFTPDSTFFDVNMIPCLCYIVSVVRRRHFSYDSPNFHLSSSHTKLKFSDVFTDFLSNYYYVFLAETYIRTSDVRVHFMYTHKSHSFYILLVFLNCKFTCV